MLWPNIKDKVNKEEEIQRGKERGKIKRSKKKTKTKKNKKEKKKEGRILKIEKKGLSSPLKYQAEFKTIK